MKCGEYIFSGYVFTIDMDPEKLFDIVCHSKLIKIYEKVVIKDRIAGKFALCFCRDCGR
jgi:hypothetical protein